MLDPKALRQNIEFVANELQKRKVTLDVAKFNALEEQRKNLQTTVQDLQNARNTNAREIGAAKARGEKLEPLLQQTQDLGNALKAHEDQLKEVQHTLHNLLAHLPNIPHSSVPYGTREQDNVVVRSWGELKQFSFTPKDHVDLGQHLGMDFASASKIAGARFVVLREPLVKLQRALIQFMLDLHTKEHGYQEIFVPSLVNEASLYGTGQLPHLREDSFEIKGAHPFFLIPTAEVPVTNLFRDEIVMDEDLPIKLVCYSSCFRSEAGSYGKDTRGMIRHHQFEKVELVMIAHPEHSYALLETLTSHAEKVLRLLELPYRVVSLCTGDLGFSSAKTYDLEVWLPAQNQYREISSCSNMESFQARRMKARFRDQKGRLELVHTLNGSGLAIGRTLVAILENNQDEAGNIAIPTVLQPYLNGLEILTPSRPFTGLRQHT